MWKILVTFTIIILFAIVLFITLKPQFQVINPPNLKPVNTTALENKTPVNAVETIVQNLEVPWAIAFLPDGNMLVTERKGSIKLINVQEKTKKEIGSIKVRQEGESGLHGITIHPNFPQKKYVYLYYAYSKSLLNNTLNRVSRFSFNKNQLKDEKIIIDKIPGGTRHDGGRLKFGPDGNLYVTTGDAENPSLAQDKNSLAGKILRVSDDGQPAGGNPFGTIVFSYGHRNPQGITWDEQNNLWETEHGSTATDELNKIEIGKNYGWPTIRGNQSRIGMVLPILQSGQDTWAPAGAAYFDGSVFFAGLRGESLFEAQIDKAPIVLKEHFKKKFGRIRDVVLSPDNFLYITTSNRDGRGGPSSSDDRILRIDPKQL